MDAVEADESGDAHPWCLRLTIEDEHIGELIFGDEALGQHEPRQCDEACCKLEVHLL